jgi:hypothetical protein
MLPLQQPAMARRTAVSAPQRQTMGTCFLVLCLLPVTSSWNALGRRRATGRALPSPQPPRNPTNFLVEHLTRDGSPSRLNKEMEVVSLTPRECGIQYHRPMNASGQDIELAWIDRKEFITPACGEATVVGQALKAYLLDSHTELVEPTTLRSMNLAIFLCVTRNQPGGIFDEYMQTLPSISALQHLPIFWSKASLRELQGSRVRDVVLERKHEWEEELAIVHAAMKHQSGTFDCDIGTWSWARSIITSRAFSDGLSSLCLVPYVDMLNHCGAAGKPGLLNAGVNKGEWLIEDGGFRLTLPRDTTVTTEGEDPDTISKVEIAYGALSNAQCLVNYGFAILNDANQTPHDTCLVSLTLNRSASTFQQQQLWEQDGVNHTISRNVSLSIGNPGPVESLLSLCRVACCQQIGELQDMTAMFVERGAQTSQTDDGLVPQMAATLSRIPFSVANELKAMSMVQQLTLHQLSMYKTTLSQDDLWLQSRRGFWHRPADKNNIRNAVIVRRGEKRVLQHFCNIASICVAFLSQPSVNFDEYKDLLEGTLQSECPCGI